MKPANQPRVKICCIGSRDEARLAVAAGASAVGLVSAMPSGPGIISEELIAEIAAIVPPPVSTFLLTSKQSVASIVDQQRRTKVSTLQICDHLIDGGYADLRIALPGIRLVQVIHVGGPESVDEAVAIAPHVDALLLDTGSKSLAVKVLGGTGRTHDWSISRRIRDAVDVPVFLAGGLNAGNVGEAIASVRPFAVDVCSGVRTDGRLDEQKLRAFFDQVHQARTETPSPGRDDV